MNTAGPVDGDPDALVPAQHRRLRLHGRQRRPRPVFRRLQALAAHERRGADESFEKGWLVLLDLGYGERGSVELEGGGEGGDFAGEGWGEGLECSAGVGGFEGLPGELLGGGKGRGGRWGWGVVGRVGMVMWGSVGLGGGGMTGADVAARLLFGVAFWSVHLADLGLWEIR